MLTYALLIGVVLIDIKWDVELFRKNACWMDHAKRFSIVAKFAVVLLFFVIGYRAFIMQG